MHMIWTSVALLALTAAVMAATSTAPGDQHGAAEPGAERGAEATTTAAVTRYPAADLQPFTLPWNDTSDGPTDVSFLNHTPAGKLGRLTAGPDGDLYFGKEKTRFFGVNVCFEACAPPQEVARTMARRMAKFGVNVVRFHHFDNTRVLLSDKTTSRKIDPEALDRLDFFIAELRKNGIYVNLNLLVSRNFVPGDGLGEEVKKAAGKVNHLLGMWHEDAFALHAEYARALLTHKNPYTGLTYAEDPAVAFVEIINENGLANYWLDAKRTPALADLPDALAQPLRKAWQAFVLKRHGSPAAARQAWALAADDPLMPGDAPTLVPVGHHAAKPGSVLRQDFLAFLRDVEANYYARMRALIRDELKCQALLKSSTAASGWVTVAAQQDVLDGHVYWDNPKWRGRTWDYMSLDWHVDNNSHIVASPGGRFRWLGYYQVQGKPYSITEYNTSAPNLHAGEAPLVLALHGGLQGWDALYMFAYDHSWKDKNTPIMGLDISQHPAKMANMAAAAVMFRRGDIQPARAASQATMTPAEELAWTAQSGKAWNMANAFMAGANGDRFYDERIQVALKPDAGTARPVQSDKSATTPTKVTSDTNQLTWDATDPQAPVMRFVSDRSAAVVGMTAGKTHALGPLAVDLPATSTGGGCVSLVLLEGDSWQTAKRAMLVVTSRVENTGMQWRKVRIEKKNVDGWELDAWGAVPTVIEPVPAECRLNTNGRTLEVHRLDGNGQRDGVVPVRVEDGQARFTLPARPATLWYELVWR